MNKSASLRHVFFSLLLAALSQPCLFASRHGSDLPSSQYGGCAQVANCSGTAPYLGSYGAITLQGSNFTVTVTPYVWGSVSFDGSSATANSTLLQVALTQAASGTAGLVAVAVGANLDGVGYVTDLGFSSPIPFTPGGVSLSDPVTGVDGGYTLWALGPNLPRQVVLAAGGTPNPSTSFTQVYPTDQTVTPTLSGSNGISAPAAAGTYAVVVFNGSSYEVVGGLPLLGEAVPCGFVSGQASVTCHDLSKPIPVSLTNGQFHDLTRADQAPTPSPYVTDTYSNGVDSATCGSSLLGTDQLSLSVVYTYTPDVNQVVDISTKGSHYETVLQVTDGTNATCSDSSANGEFFQAEIQGLQLQGGTQYFIYVGEYPPLQSADVCDAINPTTQAPGPCPLTSDPVLEFTLNVDQEGLSKSALQFIPIAPCRLADTRNQINGSLGGPKLAEDTIRQFNIPDGPCGIPATALAYSVNVTVVPDGVLQYLTLWPTGQPQPTVSTLNSDGRTKANAAIVPAGTGGSVSVFVTDPTHVILDINGYFVAAGTSSALAFYPLAPCRVADTRSANGPAGGPFLAGNSSRAFSVRSSSCGLPSGAQAYSLNVTAIPHKSLTYLTTWPAGQVRPNASTLNSPTGAITANAAIVPAGNNGDVSVFVSDDADVILDVNGYFASPTTGGLSLYATAPCRIIDTRPTTFSGVLEVGVETSACAPSPTAQSYIVNATVIPSGQLIYLSLWADGESQPYVSTLNSYDGATTSNMAIVPTVNGNIDVFADGTTNLILDTAGYFAP